MAALIPFLCLAALTWIVHQKRSRGPEGACWKESLLSASVIWGAGLVAMTEGLSPWKALSFGWVAGVWSACLFGLTLWAWRLRIGASPARPALARPRRLPADLALAAGCVCGVIAVTGFIAFSTPSVNVDAMCYHLPRVSHWIERGSVAHYPTHVQRQLWQPPGAEYLLAHLEILHGSDRLHNLPQWLSLIGCVIGVSQMAARLGAGPRGRWLAAVGCATIPMGILQSTNAQNDYVLAYWMVCLVSLLLDSSARTAVRPGGLLLAGAALGLAVLTKGTALLFAPAFLAWSCVRWRRAGAAAVVARVLLILAVCGCLNAGHWLRNFETYGHPLGTPSLQGRARLANEEWTARAFASNVARNLSLHAATGWPSANEAVERGIRRLHEWIGISENDRRTTYWNYDFRVLAPTGSEDSDGNPLHAVWIGLTLAISWIRPGRARNLTAYSAALVGGFLIFCWVLKWQPWHSRLHLPLFVLACPLAAAVPAADLDRRRFLAACAVLLVAALPALFLNRAGAVGADREVLTAVRGDAYRRFAAHERVADLLGERGCGRVGLVAGEDFLEAPLRAMLADRLRARVKLRYLDPEGFPRAAGRGKDEDGPFDPCAIVTAGRPPRSVLYYSGRSYVRESVTGPLAVYVAADADRGSAAGGGKRVPDR